MAGLLMPAPVEVRWVCLLPDPITGLDQPVRSISGQPMIWVAIDIKAAIALVKADLLPNAFRLASVVSYIDWRSRTELQRSKLLHEPGKTKGWTNPNQVCHRCAGRTPTRDSRYCNRCRHRPGPKGKTETALSKDRIVYRDDPDLGQQKPKST